MAAKFRILPVMIVVAAGVMALRASEFAFGPGPDARRAEDVARIQALVPSAGPVQIAQEKAGKKPGAGKTPEKMAAEKKTGSGTDRKRVPFRDLADITDAEVRLLRELSARREALAKREKDLRHRTALLKAAETRMDVKLVELKALQKTVTELVARKDAAEAKKVDRMVKVYQAMKPDQAANILGTLQMPVLLDVAGRMKEKKLAGILAAMPPKKAREITLELMRRRDLIDAPPLPATGG